MIKTSDFDSLTDDLEEIFQETSAQKISDMTGKEIFDVFNTDRLDYEKLILHGTSVIDRVSEGKDLPRATNEQGDTITYTQRYYGGIVPITKKMRKFDLHGRIESVAKSVTQEAWDLFDQSLADVLTQGWNTSYTDVYGESITATGPDGKSLFDTGHTTPVSGSTFRNVIQDSSGNNNPALSRDAIVQARNDARTYTDPNGLVRPIQLDNLLVAPSNEDLANRLVNSEMLPGSANNDTNPLNGSVDVEVWERLETRGDGTDTSDYWFMYDSNQVNESLNALFAERPSLDPPEQVYSNKNWDYSIDYFYTLGIGFPAYVWGSKGTN